MGWSGPLFEGHICSLGYDLLDWIEAYCCHGPGDVQGDPLDYDEEIRDFVIECYRLDPNTGRRLYREAILSRPKGRAKALALDTPVATPAGWSSMGALQVGDTVFDERGEPTSVVAVSEVFHGHDCYEVVFSDGERLIADAGHQWTVEELRKEYRPVTVDTRYLHEFQSTRADKACNFRLQMPGPLALAEQDLPIDPYVLGAWLGDGRSDMAMLTVADGEIADQFRMAGYRVEHKASYGPFGHWVFGLNPQLRAAGLLRNKHVPAQYLRASEKQRAALLQGLMDTDGTIDVTGRASFTSTRSVLVDAVVELLASLGVKCSGATEFRTKLNGADCGPGWKVDFWPADDVPVFRLGRKLARQRPRRAARRLADTRRIVAVAPVASVPTRCIAVSSGSRLFLAGRRMVQTHNSEIAGMVVVAEAFADVRFDGWDAQGQPVGRPVRSPLIKCLATEESQAGNTFENAAFVAGEWGPDVHPEIYGGVSGVRKYQSATALYLPHGGELRACTAGAASKDGGKETFVVPDESHLYVLPELRSMYGNVMRNLGKRKLAEPWALQTTTAYRPGENSIAEQKLTAWRKGDLGSDVLVDHREAKGRIDITDRPHTLGQLRALYGPAMDPTRGWMSSESVYALMNDVTVCPDEATAARYYLNRALSGQDAWIAKDVHERQKRPGDVVAAGEAITIGFDGSLNDDTTVLRGCRISDGFLFRIGAWPKPEGAAGIGWEVPRREVLATIREAFGRYNVARGYFDPHEWRSDIDALSDEFGEERVIRWATTRDVAMAGALDRLHADLNNGVVWHDDDPLAAEHYGNVFVRRKGPHRLVRKEHPQSARKIDSVVGDALAYEARADVLASGWSDKPPDTRVIVFRR